MHVYHVRREGQTPYILQFRHNLFKTCVSASPTFLVRFDTIIRFLVSGSNVEGVMQHLTAWGTQSGWGWGCVVVGDGWGWWVGVGVLVGFLCSSSPTTSRDVTWTPNCGNYQDLSCTSEFIWCDSWNIWGPIWHSFSFGLLISFDRPYPEYNISEIYDDASSVIFCPIWHSACWFLF